MFPLKSAGYVTRLAPHTAPKVFARCNLTFGERIAVHRVDSYSLCRYRGTSPIRKRTPLGPYRRPMPRILGGSEGGGRFLMGEVPLYRTRTEQTTGKSTL